MRSFWVPLNWNEYITRSISKPPVNEIEYISEQLHNQVKVENPFPMLKPLKIYLLLLFPWVTWAQNPTQSLEESLFLQRISAFWEEGEYLIAKNQMEEFLLTYPESSFSDALRASLGDLLLREKKAAEALAYYAKITDPEIAASKFLHRMQCLYSMQWYAVLADECEAYLKSLTKPSEAQTQITYYLAIALYNQCMNAIKDPEALLQLASRAEPYFEILLQNNFDDDAAHAFAYLSSILQDFPKAASIYLDLAIGENEEEMLFQASSMQAKYDPELAIQTLEKIIDMKGKRQAEAAYNALVLSFDCKKYEAIIEKKDEFLKTIPSDKIAIAHLLFARGLHILQKEEDACEELKICIAEEAKEPGDKNSTLRSAFISLLDISFHTKNTEIFLKTLNQMESLYPQDEELYRGKFFQALLLTKENKWDEAEKRLEALSLQPLKSPLKEQILLELTHINHRMQNWLSCRKNASSFLSQFPSHEETPNVERLLIAASIELSSQALLEKEQLVLDLQTVLNGESHPEEIRNFWQFLLAETLISLHQYEKALPILLQLVEETPSNAEIYLLLATCYKDGLHDLSRFCHAGEKALSLLKPLNTGSLHASLYNAYLELSLLKEANEHLFHAFKENIPIETENLLYLADEYATGDENDIAKATILLEHIASRKEDPLLEYAIIKLSKLYSATNRKEESISILEQLTEQYKNNPSFDWQCKNETTFLLGEQYATCGKEEQSLDLFDAIIQERANLKTQIGASACLQSARIRMKKWENQTPSKDDPMFQKVLTQLKDLVIQKNLSQEPLYLEAALDYIDLQARCQQTIANKLSLLLKTKKDFEDTEDFLSQDYHQARKQSPDKDLLYQSYMHFLEAEILMAQSQSFQDSHEQKELQAKAKILLLRIVEEQAHPALVARAHKCLTQ